MKRTPPVLITDAQVSQEEELKRRERRYIIMMGVRALCLVLGVVLVMLKVPLLVIWLPLCGIAMVLLPWLAVLLANDRPPLEQHRMRRHNRQTGRQTDDAVPNALPAQPTGRTIDADEPDD